MLFKRQFLAGVLSVLLASSSLVKAARSQCSAKGSSSCSGLSGFFECDLGLRDVEHVGPISRIERRVFPAITPDTQTYVRNKVTALSSANQVYKAGRDKVSTATFTKFAASSTRKVAAFNTGLQGLTGCTSVVIYSRNGVWISHIFEDQEIEENTAGAFITSKLGTANANVLKGSAGTDPVYAYILTPTYTTDTPVDAGSGTVDTTPAKGFVAGQQQYATQVTDMQTHIGQLFTGVHAGVTLYNAINPNSKDYTDSLKTTAKGRVLFEYDQSGARTFFEGTQVDVGHETFP
jgi:hypothetical protein